MKKTLALFLFLGIAASAAAQQPAAGSAQKAQMPELSKSDVDMAKLQNALSTKRRELFAAGMGGLTPQQQETFWGVYADFEKERDSVMSNRINLLKNYTENFATLSDADIVKMVNESAEIQKVDPRHADEVLRHPEREARGEGRGPVRPHRRLPDDDHAPVDPRQHAGAPGRQVGA